MTATELACPVCEREAYALGTLGYTLHCRCRFCGWNFCLDARLLESPDAAPEPTAPPPVAARPPARRARRK